jgi:5-methylcytosine-specific restriction endonuclease McrA
MRNKSIKILYDKVKEIQSQPYRFIPYKEQMKMKEWAYFRLYVIYSKGGKCEMCDFSIEKYLHVHHKEYKKRKMAWQYSLSDVMVLCKHCHKKSHMPVLREKHNRTKSIKKIING